jgi:hypothetical protein
VGQGVRRACEAVSCGPGHAIKIGRGKSDRGNRRARSGTAPLRGGEVAGVEAGASKDRSGVAGVGQRGRGRHGELNGGEEAMNPRAERVERW